MDFFDSPFHRLYDKKCKEKEVSKEAVIIAREVLSSLGDTGFISKVYIGEPPHRITIDTVIVLACGLFLIVLLIGHDAFTHLPD